jgi:thioredoxin-like negative regulator of GroEL
LVVCLNYILLKKIMMKILKTILLALVILTAGGCDQVQEKLSGLMGHKTSEQSVQSVRELIGQAKFNEAIDRAEAAWDSTPESLRGELAILAARANAVEARDDRAIYFLEQASQRLNLMDSDLLTDTFFERLRANPDFLAVLAKLSRDSHSLAPNASGRESSDASASVGSGGPSASAGGVSVKLPN